MASSTLSVPAHVVQANRGLARLAVQRLPIHDERVHHALETFVATYQAVRKVLPNHDAALYIAAQEGKHLCASRSRDVPSKQGSLRVVRDTFPYPDAPGNLIEGIEYTMPVLARYFAHVGKTAHERLRGHELPAMVNLDDRCYTFSVTHPVKLRTQIIGLDDECTSLEKYARQLFLYNPESVSNPDVGRFPKTILLSGPPGTGKSSLLAHLFATCEHLSKLTGLPCALETYDASNFSSYFGKSTRILKRMMERVEHPAGVGVLAIEDADMVLQSRDDKTAYHGVLELQQYLMNKLSGVMPYHGNTLTVFSTNHPESLDAALQNRIERTYQVNPFARREVHQAYFTARLPGLAVSEYERLAKHSHDAQLSGRDLHSIMTLAREASTRAPTDEELILRTANEKRYSPINCRIIEKLIAARNSIRSLI